MRDMGRALVLAILAVAAPVAIAGQTLVVLHIRAVLTDANGRATPVARHALIISDNPPTKETRRILTGLDGTANVRLSPGNYTVESDQPLAFQGKAYHWRQTLDIVAGRDSALDLTLANAVADLDCAGNDNRRHTARNRHLVPAAAVARQRRRSCGLRLHTRRDSWLTRPDSSPRTRESLATRRRSKCSSRARSKSRGPSSNPIVSATSRSSESTRRSWRRSHRCRLDARAAPHHQSRASRRSSCLRHRFVRTRAGLLEQ